jgi:hypothetical protein
VFLISSILTILSLLSYLLPLLFLLFFIPHVMSSSFPSYSVLYLPFLYDLPCSDLLCLLREPVGIGLLFCSSLLFPVEPDLMDSLPTALDCTLQFTVTHIQCPQSHLSSRGFLPSSRLPQTAVSLSRSSQTVLCLCYSNFQLRPLC